MGTTSYHTVNGQIVGQTKDGVRTHFLTDALGSVTTTLDDSGAVQNTYRHKPFGGLLAKTGAAADPRFLWVGAFGYRQGSAPSSLQYVRARHFWPTGAVWTSVDLLWPDQHPYEYAVSNPTTIIDSLGLSPCPTPCCCCPTGNYIPKSEVKPLDNLHGNTVYGHTFKVHLGYSFHNIDPSIGEQEGDCTLEWWEKTDVPALNVSKDTWNDMYALFPSSPTFAPWRLREKECPGSPKKPPIIIDVPALGLYAGRNVTRTLCFRIVVKKTPNCHCGSDQLASTAKQFLVVVNGHGSKRFFTIPSPPKDAYCK